tara:strand:- start:4859 stop:6178 length:1320 start_codon:yes stop_codon:yes gene_type:complete
LFGHVVQSIDETLARAAQSRVEVEGVGVSAFASSVLGLDGEGRACTPVYTYADTRNSDDAKALREDVDVAAILDRTGTPLHASYLPARFRWLRRTNPDLISRVARWVTFAEYMFESFFARPCGLSLSLAAWSGLLDRRRLIWDEGLLGSVGIDAAVLGRIDCENDPVVGLASPWISRWPLLARVPWFPALGDGLCSNLGTAGIDERAVVINVGTSAAVRTVVPGPVSEVPQGLWEYRVDRAHSLLGGAESNGGNVSTWFRETLAGLGDHEIDDVLSTETPDSHGLTVLPFFTGERSPGWNDGARATVHGLRLTTRPVDLLVAALEGVSFRLAAIYALLAPMVGETPRVRVSGGALHRSSRWTALLADVLGCSVVRSEAGEPTSRGAAIWALESLGYPSIREFDCDGVRFDPDPDRHDIYLAAQARQQQLYRQISACGTE